MVQTTVTNPREWVSSHADYLYDFALSRINDEELARDLVQETFLAALEKINTFEGKSAVRTWLTAILKNKIIDVYRRKASVQYANLNTGSESVAFFEADNGHWIDAHAPVAFGIGQQHPLDSKEFNGVLRQCMDKLPSLWTSVFTLKHIDDTPTTMICDKLKISPANFWVIIHRTKVNLRACLQKNWPV
jgi:RNA polymerase sigma-70 factor (ECF subfamily)